MRLLSVNAIDSKDVDKNQNLYLKKETDLIVLFVE